MSTVDFCSRRFQEVHLLQRLNQKSFPEI
uniref:Uncharacterized protein n=1 Tax=Rhizophora mucronata TaxID=61149 RepID=A0A2P2IX64_RHIMU